MVQQIQRESLGYTFQRVLDYCPVDSRASLGYSSQRVLDYWPVDSQGVAGLFFSTGYRQLSLRFTGRRWVILLNGFQTIVQQILWESLGYFSQRVLDYCPVDIHRESLGYSSQRVLDYFPVDSQGVAGLFFSTGSRLLSSRFSGSRSVILLNGFQTIVQQIHRETLGYSSQRVPGYCTVDIHRESLGYSSQQALDYCPLDIHRESLGYSSQQVLDYCPVDIHRESLIIVLNGFQTIVQQRFTGSRWVFFLNGFSTIVEQIHREPLGYSSQRVLDYCPVDSQGVAGLFFSAGSRLLFSRFTGSRWVILLNGFQTIVKQIHRESLGYSARRVQDNCPVDSQGVAGLFFSTGSRQFSSRYRESRWVILPNGFQTVVQQRFTGSRCFFFSTDSRLLSSRFTGSRWVILLNRFKTIVQQIHRESLGYSSQRVVDYCPVDIHSELLGYSSQLVLDYCKVDSEGVAGLFFSTGSRLLSSRFTGGRWLFFSTVSRLLSIRD